MGRAFPVFARSYPPGTSRANMGADSYMDFPTALPVRTAPTSEVLEFLEDMEIHPDRDAPHIRKIIAEAERDLERRFTTKEHGERPPKVWGPMLLDPPGSFSTTAQLEEFVERYQASEHPQLK